MPRRALHNLLLVAALLAGSAQGEVTAAERAISRTESVQAEGSHPQLDKQTDERAQGVASAETDVTDLAALAIIVLGILGLIWVRRHIAEI